MGSAAKGVGGSAKGARTIPTAASIHHTHTHGNGAPAGLMDRLVTHRAANAISIAPHRADIDAAMLATD
jgi:hypothetical protein